MRNPSLLWILLAVMLILDIYIFQALKFVSHSAGPRTRMVILISYWAVSALAIVTMALTPYMHVSHWPNHAANYVYAIILGLFFAKLLATVFFLADDLRRGLQWIVVKLFSASRRPAAPGAEGISRSVFVSWLGLALGGGLFSSLLYGFTNKYNYRIHRHRLSFDRLPPAFRGMKIVQISDIHSGSFTDKDAVRRGVDMIIQEKADLILFTGDLVNDKATEMLGYKEVFARILRQWAYFPHSATTIMAITPNGNRRQPKRPTSTTSKPYTQIWVGGC